MKHMLERSQGFALPTILIASVIMLIVLMSAITAVNGITGGLNSQYYNQLSREAAESGLAHAERCLRLSNYSPTWTDANPLRPDTDCNGVVQGGYSKYIVNTANVRTTYTVKLPTTGPSSSVYVVANGTTELTRTSNPDNPWKVYSATTGKNSRYIDTPQIAGGAGWKTAGHDGYMLTSSGILFGWGDNSSQQLGDSSLGTTVMTPVQLVLPSGVTRVKKVFNSGQGASIVCILGGNDQVYCRGTPGAGENGLMPATPGWHRFGLPVGLSATQEVDVNGFGPDSMCLIASDQQAYCAGFNDNGFLGNAATTAAVIPISAPTKFRLDLASPGPVSGLATSLTAKKVFNKDRFTCVIASDNQAYCAGDNYAGQLGQGNFAANNGAGKSIPGRVLVPGNPNVLDVRLTYHGGIEGVFVLVSDGSVYMSGGNWEGTANDGAFTGSCANGGGWNCYPTPRSITSPGFNDFISTGEEGNGNHAICHVGQTAAAINAGNSGLWCIGENHYGQLGSGDCTSKATYFGGSNLGGQIIKPTVNIEGRYQMNSLMVITTSGDVYAAGDNTYGKLGTNGPLQACNGTFAKVQLPAGVKALAVANGDEYTAYVLGDNGKVYSMGRNNNGQLGNGTMTDSKVPVEVKLPRQETLF